MKFAAQTFISCPPSPIDAIRVLAMIPTALSGERLPALAPLATIKAVRNGGIAAGAAIALGTAPFLPAGAPILLAGLGAAVGWAVARRRVGATL